MAYRFKLNEDFASGLERIGLEQIRRALAQFVEVTDQATAIHETRKVLKRTRALLHLVRPGISDVQFKRENRRLRDIGRMLSGLRDRSVLIATITELMALADGPEKSALELLQTDLARLPMVDRGKDEERIAGAKRGLDKALSAWSRLRLEPDSFAPIEEGLARQYRTCRDCFADAYRIGSDDAFHTWRKTVQQHWRHMRLLQRGWPDYFAARQNEAAALSAVLGKAQDLALLIAHIDGPGGKIIKPRQAERVIKLVRRQQVALRRTAAPLAERLCAEGPTGHARRAALYWEAAKRGASRSDPASVAATSPDGAASDNRRRKAERGTAAIDALGPPVPALKAVAPADRSATLPARTSALVHKSPPARAARRANTRKPARRKPPGT